MKFGTFPIDQSAGLILAHAVVTPSRRLKKGYQLTAEDIRTLKEEAVPEVMGAILEVGDVQEDNAAQRLAACVAGPGCSITAPFTGRCNLISEHAGILTLNESAIHRANTVDEAITLATLEQFERVSAGQTIATAKIIPFSCREKDLSGIEEHARAVAPVLRVHPFSAKKVVLISTVLPETKPSVLDKSKSVLEARLGDCQNELAEETRCNHAVSNLTASISGALKDGAELVLIFGASAITDRADVIPAAIEAAGGAVDHLGMPVDPGNLLLLGHHGDVPVIGLPGCARSPKLNGFDWVLERLLADVPVNRDHIMSMGVGGLLKEIPTRPQPREKETVDTAEPKIGAVILAAGQSRRMGPANKLLEDLDGKPMVRHVADAVLASGFERTLVVTGHDAARVEKALSSLPVSFAQNDDFASGLSASLKVGIKQALQTSPNLDAVIVCLGDMPRITADHLKALKDAFDPSQDHRIVVPTHLGKRGNPVIWGRDFFDDIMGLKGDVGARSLIGQYEDSVIEVPLDTDAIFLDIDTPAALAAERDT